MRIIFRQFLGKLHSWSVIGWGLADALISEGHQVELFSTDGIKHLPSHLKTNLIGYVEENDSKIVGSYPDTNYDLQISYTSMKNFPNYLVHGRRKYGIWCFEWSGKNILPTGFAKNYKYCDKILSPSHYVKTDIFMTSGIPGSAIKVVPHGIDINQYKKESTIKLPTDKKYKILANIAQLHLRKNIPGLLESYGRAFTNKDDVCLILKAKDKKPVSQFDISLQDCIKNFKIKYPNHADIKILSNFIEDMSELYRSVDAVYTMSHGEGFYMPGLEGLAAGKLSIAPNIGGQVDFLNNDNSYLIKSDVVPANPKSMYWESKSGAMWINPDLDDAANQLKLSYKNYTEKNSYNESQKEKIWEKYSWETISKQIINEC